MRLEKWQTREILSAHDSAKRLAVAASSDQALDPDMRATVFAEIYRLALRRAIEPQSSGASVEDYLPGRPA